MIEALILLGAAALFAALPERVGLLKTSNVIAVTVVAMLMTGLVLKALVPRPEVANWGPGLSEGVQNTIIISGGSATKRGVDDEVLSRELRDAGFGVQTVHLGLAGASHYERRSDLAKILSEALAKAPPDGRVILALEVWYLYDVDPMVQLDSIKFTRRGFAYLDVATASTMLVDLVFTNVLERGKKVDVEAVRILLAHGAIDLLNIGALRQNLRGARRYGYEILRRTPSPGTAPTTDTIAATLAQTGSEPKPPFTEETTAYIDNFRKVVLGSAFQDSRLRIAAYMPPNLHPPTNSYLPEFCERTTLPIYCLQAPADNGFLLNKLREPRFWWDRVHLRPEGANLYSRWLASQLLHRELLVR
jgi:hypothetical protein